MIGGMRNTRKGLKGDDDTSGGDGDDKKAIDGSGGKPAGAKAEEAKKV